MFDPTIACGIPGLRGVGLWLVCVGLGFAVGSLLRERWYIPAIIGAAIGGTLIPFANVSSPRLPGMGWDQGAWLLVAIVFEANAIVWALRRFADDDDGLVRALLLAVAAHFVFMVPAFGRPMAVFALASLLVAGAGWWWRQRLRRLPPALADSAVKVGGGAWMVALTTSFR